MLGVVRIRYLIRRNPPMSLRYCQCDCLMRAIFARQLSEREQEVEDARQREVENNEVRQDGLRLSATGAGGGEQRHHPASCRVCGFSHSRHARGYQFFDEGLWILLFETLIQEM